MDYPIEGGCTCGQVCYRMLGAPLVHCCHCRWCQREGGASP
ncbi:GFA family protein [Lysobacter sp. F6437]